MPKLFRMAGWCFLVMVGLLLACAPAADGAGNGPEVAIIPIEGTINPGMPGFVRRSLEDAAEKGAAAVIMELNTPGGYTDVAEKIRGYMDEFPGPVYAFVRPQAISAGAYLALAADEIYMVPGAIMGAAEPRYLDGQTDEKILSYWEKQMTGLAERRGRDPIAAAMVRGDRHSGSRWSCSPDRQRSAGARHSEGTVDNRGELLALLGLSGAEPVEHSLTITDQIVGWTTNPVVATILLVVGIGGLVVEIFTAGFGVAGFLSLLAFTLYFGGHIAAGLADYWVVFLFIFGVVMLIAEAFMPALVCLVSPACSLW